jgi:hypothetical protein
MSEQLSLFGTTPAKGEYALAQAQRGSCKSCGAAIAWTTTPSGAAIPLDLAHTVSYEGERYAPTHFAYCPHGAHWRHKR